MDFWPTSDQEALRDGVRALLAGRFDLDDLAERESTPDPIDPARWRELADTGIFSLRADGLGMREAVIVFEELGRHLVPGPLVTTHLAAGLIDGAASGDAIVGSFEPSPAATVVEHTGQTSRLLWFRSGQLICLDPATLDWDVIERPLDPLSPTARCTTPIDRIHGETLVSGTDADVLHRDGVVLIAALQLGVALAALDLANGYAKGREQFGRPVGSFQAVKHLLADMLVKAEVARSAVYAAACAVDGAGDGTDVGRTAAAAKLMAGEAAVFNARTGIQVHGGMGFTWEVHAQRYWKRAVVLDSSFGTGDHHALAIAATL
jgi:alkylation response protein AidB-like acyl-CoA dehydrogenase